MRDIDYDPEEASPYECFDCGTIVVAERRPGGCVDCGSELRNRLTSIE